MLGDETTRVEVLFVVGGDDVAGAAADEEGSDNGVELAPAFDEVAAPETLELLMLAADDNDVMMEEKTYE